MMDLARCSWPMARAGEAIEQLAARSGLHHARPDLPDAPALLLAQDGEPAKTREATKTWIRTLAACLEVGVEPELASYGNLRMLLASGPALVEIRIEGEWRLLAVTGCSRRTGRIHCISPELKPVCLELRALRSALAGPLERHLEPALAHVVQGAGVQGRARARVFEAMLAERLSSVPVAQVWRLSMPPSSGLLRELRRAGVAGQLALFIGANAVEYGLWIVVWVLAGRWALAGRFDMGWLLAWGLVLLTIAPVHAIAAWNQAKLAIHSSCVMMRALLEGSFRLDPEEARGEGAGQLLGRVLDTEALHTLALTGGLTGVVAVLQLVAAAALLVLGAQAPGIAWLLGAWIVLTLGLGWTYYRRRRAWTAARVNLTSDTTERMAGHRTRVTQQPPEKWHSGEDEALAGYVEQSRGMDRLAVVFAGFLPRAWLIVGVAAMAHGFIARTLSAPMIAAQLGAILLAHNSLKALSAALASLSGAAIALERVRHLLAASRRVEPPGDPAIAVAVAHSPGRPVMAMRDVSYRYAGRASNAVERATLSIGERDCVLLQGASGSGKSTWAALASGFRVPQGGLLFLRGIDRKTIGGREWRRRVASAPQFHENHTLAGSLAFNLLMGRDWPPDPEDLREAEEVCRELGLGPLIDSMPAGLMQNVGETGWQLSNGEKSRVYLARALLQRANLVVLDETFGALDAQTAQGALDCVLHRAPALICIAHV